MLHKRFLSIFLIFIFVLSCKVLVLGATKQTTVNSSIMNSSQITAGIKSFTDSLVKNGKMTKVQADAVNAALKSGSNSKKTVKAILDSLIKNNKLTSAIGDNILNFIEPKRVNFQRFNPLDNLVKEKIINQKQADAVENAIGNNRNAFGNMKGLLDPLVKSKTITAAQEESIIKTYSPPGNGKFGRQPDNFYNELVKNGTITQAQSEKIMEAIRDSRQSGKSFNDILNQMVKDKIINSKQEKAILDVMPQQGGRRNQNN